MPGMTSPACTSRLRRTRRRLRHGARGCCTVEDANDARRAADVLGIPFYIWDLAERFRAEVIDDFVAEYAAGHTPNPCLRCNEKIKFSAVLDRALALGFDAVVTGHHARLENGVLRRSVDSAKDQSYVLAVLTPQQLAHAIFPLGDSTKATVRDEAAARGLAVAAKPDSHDICFIADGDTRGFLQRKLGEMPPVRSSTPRPATCWAATRARSASRSGSGAACTSTVRRRAANRGTCSRSSPRRTECWWDGANCSMSTRCAPVRPVWTTASPADRFTSAVQLRAHGMVSAADVTVDGDELVAHLAEPQRGVAAGQALVMYDGDVVIGSATITSAERAAAHV